MISAERMKSVLMAPATFSSSRSRRSGHRTELGLVRVRVVRHDGVEDFFDAFVAEIGAAKHQQRDDGARQEVAERQSDRQQNQELVAEDPLAILATIGSRAWTRSRPHSAA